MTEKALYPISLQRDAGLPHLQRQAVDANETRLNENFKRIAERLTELARLAGSGAQGVTFMPHIDGDGVLTWTNDGGLPNPAPVHIGGGTLLPATGDLLGGVKVGDNLTVTQDGVLSVLTADDAEEDNTRPITSAAVHTEIGNIAVLLATI